MDEVLPSPPVSAEILSLPKESTSILQKEVQSDEVQPAHQSLGLDDQIDHIGLSTQEPPGEKRRRSSGGDCLQGHPGKRGKREGIDNEKGDTPLQSIRSLCQGPDAVSHWARTGSWPTDFAQMSQDQNNNPLKRSLSIVSYSQGVRDGTHPPAHTPGSQPFLEKHGIEFNDIDTRSALDPGSKELCEALLVAQKHGPAYVSLTLDEYLELLGDITNRNEARIFRDLTPHIVPSAYLLYRRNGDVTLRDTSEELSTTWSKCATLGGTIPRPDYAVGVAAGAFSEDEKAKLQNCTTMWKPSKFTEFMYYPFLVCEAKCASGNINQANMQNIHSASIAVSAIVELHRTVSEESAASLGGKILVFSVSHDNKQVEIWGHFPLFRDGRGTFHRYHIETYSLDRYDGRDREKSGNVVREIYRKFYPQHLQRIHDALAQLKDPSTTSMMSTPSVDEADSQPSGPSSQDIGGFKRPALRRAESQGQLTVMRQHVAQQETLHKAQLEQQQAQLQQQQAQLQQQQAQLQQLQARLQQQQAP